jgi:hypothetical protein
MKELLLLASEKGLNYMAIVSNILVVPTACIRVFNLRCCGRCATLQASI